MSEIDTTGTSPPWGPTTKLVVGLSFVAVVAALLIRFRGIIGPLILAFILSYVLHPVANRLCLATRLSWRASVNVIFLVLVVILVVLSTLTGLAVIQQLQSLVGLVQLFLTDLPELAEELSNRTYLIGPFTLDFSQFDLALVSEQLLNAVQPLLGQVGALIRTFATSAVGGLGWGIFILLIAYFVLSDSGRWFPEVLASLDIPGHQEDMRRLGRKLGRVWNEFLRGQLFLFVLSVMSSVVILTGLGVRFALGLALLSGLARFVPYVGPLSVWIVTLLVTLFQEGNYLGVTQLQYAIIVVVAQVILDQVFDNFLSPRIMGLTLGVHPAAVLVAAIVATNLIGLVGLLLAAPSLASIQLIGSYAFRKMLELDPWPGQDDDLQASTFGLAAFSRAWMAVLRQVNRRVSKRRAEDADR